MKFFLAQSRGNLNTISAITISYIEFHVKKMRCYLPVSLGLFEPLRRDLTRSKGGLYFKYHLVYHNVNVMNWLYLEFSLSSVTIIIIIIVSITKFSIVIGSPRAYLSRNRRAITWVSDYRCLIWTFSNRTPVIGYPRDFHVNYASFNGFLSNVFYSFQNLGQALRTFSLKRSS